VWGCAFAVDDGPIEWWAPDDRIPEPFILAAQDPTWLTCAYNDTFERLITQHVTGPRYGFPLVPIERRRCLQASSLALALPGRLDKVAKALGLEAQKDTAGHRVMLQMARPRKPREGEDPSGIHWVDDPEKHEALQAYSKADVAVERALYHRIGLLPEDEQELWRLDSIINDRGIYLDGDLIEAAIGVCEQVKPALRAELATLTGGLVVSLDQHIKLKAWLNANGCLIKDVQSETIEKALKGNSIDTTVRRVLELRRDGAHAAVHKYQAMRAWRADDGRAHGAFRYHGASTGRWSAHGVQLQNLKRPDDIEDIGTAIELVRAGDIEGIRRVHSSPLQVVGNVVRGAVAAAKGQELIAGDLSGAESRVTAWLCGETWKLEQWAKFDESGKPEDEPYYINGIGFGLSPEIARGPGKTSDLAFGYGGSIPAWRKLAPDDKSSDEQILSRRNMWQAKHPMTVRFWGQINRAAIRAVHKPGTVRRCGRLAFEVVGDFLFMTLPSGRKIAYPFPRLVENDRGDLAVVYKDNQKGQWVDCRGGDGAYHGTWMENAVSGIARDLFAQAMPRLEAAGYPITIHVHDEIGAEIPIGFGSNEEFRRLLIELPVWAAGLPLSAKVRRGPRFCKISPPKASPAHEPRLEPPPPPPRMGGASSSSRSNGPRRDYPHGEDKGGRLLDTYVYKNHLGQLYLKVEKRSPPPGKTRAQYPQFHWTGTDWAIGKPAGPKIPYRLPELLASQATAPTPVHVPEGEKDANSLAKLGVVATTCSEGAKPRTTTIPGERSPRRRRGR
jgi:DNA polymerase